MVHTPVQGVGEGGVSSPAWQMAMLGSPETQKHPDSRSLGQREAVTFQPCPLPHPTDGNRGWAAPRRAGKRAWPGSKHIVSPRYEPGRILHSGGYTGHCPQGTAVPEGRVTFNLEHF